MKKAWIVVTVATVLAGTMGLAQAGVPAQPPAETSAAAVAAASGHTAPAASPSGMQDQSTSTSNQDTSTPTVPGAHTAQSQALGDGAQMAIAGGVILAAGVVAFATHSGSSNNSTTPGTSGTTGSTGTTGTH